MPVAPKGDHHHHGGGYLFFQSPVVITHRNSIRCPLVFDVSVLCMYYVSIQSMPHQSALYIQEYMHTFIIIIIIILHRSSSCTLIIVFVVGRISILGQIPVQGDYLHHYGLILVSSTYHHWLYANVWMER
jgi:hypothetical protein